MTVEYYAHISEDGRSQTVAEHLRNTGEQCAAFANAFGAKEQGLLIGLAHDIGKCSSEFQDRLYGGRIVDHASAGALECAKQDALWAACCVAGHHGGLPDVGNQYNDVAGDPTLIGRLKRALANQISSYECPVSLPSVKNPPQYGKDYLTDSFIIRMLYSCLVDADYLDTEAFMTGEGRTEALGEPMPVLLDKLERYIVPWQNPITELNRARYRILRSCIESGAKEKGLFTLTVPTGGGKTVASMAFALNHAVKHGMEHIIYVIPYTSIIEQTAEIFRTIFGAESVLEHHGNASYEIPEQGKRSCYNLAKAVENWDAPIIVTTAVQFFESIYSNKPSKCRKLHRLANSVLIFDEAQMLPTEQLRPCVAAIAKLVASFNSTAVLCTATQPMLNDLFSQYDPIHKAIELCPNIEGLFTRLQRVCFNNLGKIDEMELAEKIAEQDQVLCIVNSRDAAQRIFELLPNEGSYHLSTRMFSAHRRRVLSEIRNRLKTGKLCRVVSTSLIEAGVDVDFPSVFREMAGLDSVLQAAGRCNREGKRRVNESVVSIFEGISTPPQLLKVNIGAAKEALRDSADPASIKTIAEYFRAYRSLAGSKLDKSDVISITRYGIQGTMLPFRTIAERFRMINDQTKTIYVPLEEGKHLISRLKAGERSRELFRNLGQFSVSVYERQFSELQEQGSIELIDENTGILADTSMYVQEIGLVLEDNNSTGLFV